MPLSLPIKRIQPTAFQKVRTATEQAVSYFRPNIILLLFFIASIILEIFNKGSAGWYIFASVYAVCFFLERIALILKRRITFPRLTQRSLKGKIKDETKNQENKNM